jgi:hypothetical protein
MVCAGGWWLVVSSWWASCSPLATRYVSTWPFKKKRSNCQIIRCSLTFAAEKKKAALKRK